MVKKIISFILILSIGLLISCSETSTSSEPDPKNQSEETERTTGTLDVNTATDGNGTDEDGYAVTLDNGDPQAIGIEDTITFEDLEEGSYSVELSDLATGCNMKSDNPVSVDISADETTTTTFEITCQQSAAEGTIVYIQRIDQSTTYLFTMNADGSAKQKIGDGISGGFPSISPDGSKIAYTVERAIWVVDLDGSNAHQLTTPEEFYEDAFPAWSPDGAKIVYQSDVEKNYNNSEIFVMDVDGSNQIRLTEHQAEDERPSWSPDGKTIIFSSDRDDDGNAELYSIDVGSGEVSVLLEPTDDNGINLGDPAWSPDGSQIAYQGFTKQGHARIFIADADGQNPNYITSTDFAALQPTWSPGGKYIAFMNLSDGNKTDAVWTIKIDDSQTTKLTDDESTYSSFPSWGPAME